MATFNNGDSGSSVRTKINAVLQHADGTSGELVINDAGADVDFRVESDTNANAIFMDGANGNIGIGTNAPGFFSGKLTIAGGNLAISGGNEAIFWNTGGTGKASIQGVGTHELAFFSHVTEAMRIDASRRVLIGTTSASGANLLQVNSDARINGLTVGMGAGAVSSNTAVGNGAFTSNTTGFQNVAVGLSALYTNSTGSGNVASGHSALYANTTGSNNVAIGRAVLQTNTTGNANTAVGDGALAGNAAGGNNNTAVGFYSLLGNTAGAYNTAIGHGAGQNLTTGSSNTIIGSIAGTAGLANTVIIGAGTTERLRIDSAGNFGIGTNAPNAASIIDAQSTTKGVRFPNMTTTEKNAIANVAGNVIFDTTLGKLCVNTGSGWQTITSA